MNLQLLLTGDELLSGDIVDTNSSWLASRLKEQGIAVSRKTTVGDDLDDLVQALNALSQQADVLIVNGGLGPTIDDMTAQALSLVSGQPLQMHPDALAHLESWSNVRSFELTEANLKQALLPADVNIVHNATGTAPGFSAVVNDCLIICTPGVPSELKRMFDDEIAPLLNTMTPGETASTTRLLVFGIGESDIQQMISDQLSDWPQQLTLGFRAQMTSLEVKVTGSDEALKAQWVERLHNLLGDNIIGPGDSSVAGETVKLLQGKGLWLSTAESCTGGMISSQITANSGASEVFSHGFITYSNTAKHQMIGVDTDILENHGAVSEQTVRQMTQGALQYSASDLAVAVTGIAGPTGGSEEKPVGTVWIGWGSLDHIEAVKLVLPARSRGFFQHMVATIALDLIRRRLIKSSETPKYLKRYAA